MGALDDLIAGGKSKGKGKPSDEKRSALQQLGDMARDLPRAIVGLPGDLKTELDTYAKSMFPELPASKDIKRRRGESAKEHALRTSPIFGAAVESFKETGGRVAESIASLAPGGLKPSETEYARASEEGRSVPLLVEDLANIAGLLTLGRVGGANVAKATATRAPKIAAAARGVEKVAGAPRVPFQVAGRGAKKAGGAIYDRALQAPLTGNALRSTRMDRDSRLLRKEALHTGFEKFTAGLGAAVRRGEDLQRILPDVDEQRAATLVGEGEAKALAELRRHRPDEFEAYVTKTYGETVPVRAAHLAADVVDGTDKALANRIDRALEFGRESPGGRRARSEAYYASGVPGRAEQAGHKPLSHEVERQTAKIKANAARARKIADEMAGRSETAVLRKALIEDHVNPDAPPQRRPAGGSKPSTAETKAPDAAPVMPDKAGEADPADADRFLRETLEQTTKIRNAQYGSGGLPFRERIRVYRGDYHVAVRVTQATQGKQIDVTVTDLDGFRKTFRSINDDAAIRDAAAYLSDRPKTPDAAPTAVDNGEPGKVLTFRPDDKPPIVRVVNKGDNVFPLRQAVATNGRVQRLAVEADRAVQLAKRAEGVAKSYERRAFRVESEARNALTSAPARLRPVLQRNREVSSLLVEQANRLRKDGLELDAKRVEKALDEIPTTLARLEAAGIDAEYFAHIRPGAKESTAGVGAGDRLPKLRKGREEKQRKGSPTYERTVRAQTQAEVDDLKIRVAADVVAKIRTMPFVRHFSSVKEGEAAGYVAWDPKNPFGKAPQITATTTFVPKHVFEGFQKHFVDGDFEKIMRRVFDPAQQAFKIVVLPLSPSWQVGNVFGNMLLATLAGGVNPARLAVSLKKAISTYRASGPRGQRNWESIADRRLFMSGPTYEELRFLREPADQLLGDGKVARGIRKGAAPLAWTVRKSYNLNTFVDNLGRSAVYLAKTGKGAAPERALKEALQAMGDFSRMTPFERKVVRRIIPFYAWQRHLTQLAFRLPIEHPLRTAWTLHLADLYGSDKEIEGLLDYMRGAIPLGDKLLGTGGLNPFERVGGMLLPDNARRSISPIIKLGLENLPGSPSRGMSLFTGKPYTRPPGTAKVDDFGRELPTAPSVRHQVAQISPQVRLADALRGRTAVARYESGDPILVNGRPLPTPDKGPLQGFLRFMGFPLTSKEAARAMAAREKERRRDAQRARERYERRAARAR